MKGLEGCEADGVQDDVASPNGDAVNPSFRKQPEGLMYAASEHPGPKARDKDVEGWRASPFSRI
ncbi:hypothetical protein FACS189476_10100 [Spirochaetia bacterium]|nr:hypothetical protein FACS189476_10100 [Spirochaetia bacterium]